MTPETQAAIRESFHIALPIILVGKDPQPIVWGKDGKLLAWNNVSLVLPPARVLWESGFTLAAVLKAVSAVTNVSINDLFSDRRFREIARPRQVACFLMVELSRASTPQIGNFIGGRDHSTIIHAIRVVRQKLDEGDELTTTIYRNAKRELGI